MPNGFGAGAGPAGIGLETFNFSTSIILTAGEIYYLQPVVQSGDNPWDIMTIGDTYPNGQLFVNGAGFSTDFWFREGIVPEPTSLALVGLSSLLAYAFKRRSKLFILLLFTLPVLSVHAADSVVQATADAAGLTPVSATTLPVVGTFWVMTLDSDGNLMESPDPFLPDDLSTMPIYSVTNDIFIVDDTGGQLSSSGTRMSSAQAASIVQTQAQAIAGLIDQIETFPNGEIDETFQPDGFTPMVYTNGLWLESWRTNQNNLRLRLHGTVSGDNYQLLSTTNLTNINWNLGQILFYANDSYTDLLPIPMTNPPTFFRAHHANPIMEIWSGYYNGQYAIEPNPANNDPGQIGTFYIENEGSATNDVTVYYTIGGTAQNGVDYSNLTGSVVVPVSSYNAEIDIDPIADGLKPDQTISLTLVQNTNYLIDPVSYSATNALYANPEVYPTVRGDTESPCPNTSWPINLASDANDPRDPSGMSLTYSIVTWPTHGTLTTNAVPPNFYVTYTPTNCYEGQDSFTFTASDGQYTSAPATVTLIIADAVYAYPPSPQTCRGTPVGITLSGGDNCGETLSYAELSQPVHGTLSGSPPNLIYTPNGTNFTGTDSFNYIVYSDCGGDWATNTVVITIGDLYFGPSSQMVFTGTNRPVAITLGAVDYDTCTTDTNYYTYTVTSYPTNGTLSGIPPNVIYQPNTNYEGMDTFQFEVSDGVWTSTYAVAVTLYVGAGPVLSTACDPFGTAPQLVWSLDSNVQQMVQQYGLGIVDFIIYRSAVAGGPYTAIATNDVSQLYYFDPGTGLGQTNHYVVTYQTVESGVTNESPYSNELALTGQNPDDLIPPNAVWDAVTNLSYPTNVIRLQAPFSSQYPTQYANLYPWPNSYWPQSSTWSNHITLFIATNSVPLAQVQYSIAIDNNYQLYLNDSNAPIESVNHDGFATWSSFMPFPNLLHYGTNDIRVVIQDVGAIDYFSMVVTTNTCGW